MEIAIGIFLFLLAIHGTNANTVHKETVMKTKMKIKEIKIDPDFESLFSIDEETLEAIQRDIEENGYDMTQPVKIWQGYLADGYTRKLAAERAGLDEIPVLELDFKEKHEVLEYLIKVHHLRRQWRDPAKYNAIIRIDKKATRGRKLKNSKASEKVDTAAETGRLVGVSKTFVVHVRAIHDHGDEAMIQSIKRGELTINKAYQAVRKCKKAEKGEGKKENKEGNGAQGDDDKSGNPGEQANAGSDDDDENRGPTFSRADDGAPWAWIWEPLSASDNGPELQPDELEAPGNTPPPESDDLRDRLVLVSPTRDPLGNHVKKDWLDAMLKAIADNPQWTFAICTKNVTRLPGTTFPPNCMVGAAVDRQKRMEPTIEAFNKMVEKGNRPPVLFLAFDPLREKIDFNNGDGKNIDWVIVGPGMESGDNNTAQVEWNWVVRILALAVKGECKVFLTPGLQWIPREFPEMPDEDPR